MTSQVLWGKWGPRKRVSQDQEYEDSSSDRPQEETSGLKVAHGSHPRPDSLTSGLAGLK